jgi:hypothetical protein
VILSSMSKAGLSSSQQLNNWLLYTEHWVGIELCSLLSLAVPWKPIVPPSAVWLSKVVLTLFAESREANGSLNEGKL